MMKKLQYILIMAQVLMTAPALSAPSATHFDDVTKFSTTLDTTIGIQCGGGQVPKLGSNGVWQCVNNMPTIDCTGSNNAVTSVTGGVATCTNTLIYAQGSCGSGQVAVSVDVGG